MRRARANRTKRRRHAALGCALAIAAACAAPEPTPRVDALAPFTTTLRDQQPDDAFAAVYRTGRNHLVWLAAKHATRTDSRTFKLINDVYGAFAFDLTIVEGCPTSWGVNPARLIAYAEEGAAAENDGFQQRGEIVPAVMGARAQGADVLCGEPDDEQLKTRVLELGFQPSDLLGFYTLRSIPQWIRERRIDNAADPRITDLLVKELEKNRERLKLSPDILPDLASWRAWYERTNEKPLGADFVTEEVGPLADGAHGTNAVAAAISRARAAHLHERVIAEVAARKTVLVVYGASHLMIHRPALDAALGQPRVIGVDALDDEFGDHR